MAVLEPGKIRNVAVVGHRGTGKTSLVEALLFQTGQTNRLGTVEAGTTVSDWEEDEQKRQMSLAASLANADWRERKINLVDTPGDAGFQADTAAAFRVVEGALVVASGVMGVEVNTGRVWRRAEELELSRVVFVNMLDRERADFFRTLEAFRSQLSDRCVAIHLPIGAEHEMTGIVDLLHMCAYMDPGGGKEPGPSEIPAEMADAGGGVPREASRRRRRDGRGPDGALPRRRGAADRGHRPRPQGRRHARRALPRRLRRRDEEPRHDRAPRPARRGRPVARQEGHDDRVRRRAAGRLHLQDDRRPVRRPHPVFRVLAGPVTGDTTLVDPRTHAKERLGQILLMRGKDHTHADGVGVGDLGAVAKLKDVVTGDVLVDHEVPVEPPHIEFAEPVMSFAVTPKAKGDEEKMATALRRLAEEDPEQDLRRAQGSDRDRRTG